MRTRFIFLLLLSSFLLIPSGFINAQSPGNMATISDDLTVFIHTGPSRNYRIIGTIQAGSPVEVLAREGDPEFIQINDSEGRTGWVQAEYVSTSGSIREQLPALSAEVERLEAEMAKVKARYQQVDQENVLLLQQQARLSTELAAANDLAEKLQQQVDEADNTAMIEWFTRGGIVAAACIFLGILITYLPKKRRKNDQWM